MPYHRNSVSPNSPLEDLAAAARAGHEEVLDSDARALAVARDTGDALQWAMDRRPKRGWKAWKADNCSKIADSSDRLYRRLAKHREEIERERENNPKLSIEAARKLIRSKPATPKLQPEVVDHWSKLGDSEIQRHLADAGVDAFLQKWMPLGWSDQLADHVTPVDHKHKTVRDRVLTQRIREVVLHLVRGEAQKALNAGIELANYINGQGIDARRLEVRVDAEDAPTKRRPPLMKGNSKIIQFPGSDRAH